MYRNTDDDYIGRITAPVLGDEYHTHYVENPQTGQQIDLIEIQPDALQPRDWQHPAQGDLVIGMHAADPQAAFEAMQAAEPDVRYSTPRPLEEESGIQFDWRDGQRSILTTGQPFAFLHYSPEDAPTARRFYEEVLGVPWEPIDAARYRMLGIEGRVEVIVTPEARRLAFDRWGKRYAGANHFRLINRDFAAIEAGVTRTGLGGYVIPPMGPFMFIHGPTGETIEMFDSSFGQEAAAASS